MMGKYLIYCFIVVFHVTGTTGQDPLPKDCPFFATGTTDRLCENSRGFSVLPESVYLKWATVIGETATGGTGPSVARFNDRDFYYGYFQSDGVAAGLQTALMTPILDVSSYDDICVGFDFSMYGSDIGQLYLVYEYNDFDSLTDVAYPGPLVDDSNRKEILIQDGDLGVRDWFTTYHHVDVSAIDSIQVKWQVRIAGGPLGDVALDNITIVSGQGNCETTPSVDGVWSEWTIWTSCSATCGDGQRSRTRSCDDPSPSGTGAACSGSDMETQSCSLGNCPEAVDGNWGAWEDVGPCTVTCGGGQKSIRRLCNDPEPSNGGAECDVDGGEPSLEQTMTVICNIELCSVNIDGMWTGWSEWDDCTVTCGGGLRRRERTCTDPSPAGTGSDCIGSGIATESCSVDTCPVVVDGEWGEWMVGSCSVTCGTGFIEQTRECDDPSPSGGGLECLLTGSSTLRGDKESITQSCTFGPCPPVIDGNWGAWEDVGNCSVTCGGGQRTIRRLCNDPSPANGGAECAVEGGEPALEQTATAICNADACPVDGMWSEWTIWTSCSATCGDGQRTRTRSCDDPSPVGTGADCSGSDMETESCSLGNCPVTDGGWGEWMFEACSETCGVGVTTKTRECVDPVPASGGLECLLTDSLTLRGDKESITEECTDGVCPVDGGWGNWIDGECSATCGSGMLERLRNCDDPIPMGAGLMCLRGDDTRGSQESGSAECFRAACFVNGMWSAWVIDECSVSCGGGFADRFRSCDDPSPSGGGDECLKTDGMSGLSESLSLSCNTESCPVDGVWSEWEESECTASCGGGFTEKTRHCNDPSPGSGGAECTKEDSTQGLVESISGVCNEDPCIVDGMWGGWSSWTSCSVSCNVGSQFRDRSCDDPAPQNGGAECDGEKSESKNCFLDACPVAEIWSEWTNWSECSGTCGVGMRSRERTCENYPDACASEKEHESESCTEGCRLATCPTSAPGPCDCNFETDCGNWIADGLTNTWHVGSVTSSANTGPIGDHTLDSAACGTFAFFESSGIPSGTVGYLASPFKNISVAEQCLTFYLSMYSTFPEQMGSLAVLVWRQYGLEEIQVFEGTTTDDPSVWTQVNLELNFEIGESTYIVFQATKGISFLSDIAIDDITLTDGSCAGRVDGRWTFWSEWGSCDVTCGAGSQMRSRSCTDPAPSNGGQECTGTAMESRSCPDLDECLVAGGWSEWSIWTSCSTTCGDGEQSRLRECLDPSTDDHGDVAPCTRSDSTTGFEETETAACSNAVCTIDGEWSNWSDYGDCTATCGDATQQRTRSCNDPSPTGFGTMCTNMNSIAALEETMTLDCDLDECPVHGGLTDWSEWSGCSATCGTTEERSRSCTDPEPMFGGSECPGATLIETRDCGDAVCPVDGVWSNWANDGDCTVTCGEGLQPEIRQCNDPAPEGSGSACDGGDGSVETRVMVMCNPGICPVDGAWSEWTGFSSCSATCDMGMSTRTRDCDDPSPAGTGMQCRKSNGIDDVFESETETCNLGHCPDPDDCTFEMTDDGGASYMPITCGFDIVDPPLNRWRINSGRTATSDTGPYSDHTLQTDQGYYVYFETSSRFNNERFPSDTNSFSLAQSSFSGSRCMSFWLHMFANKTSSVSITPFAVFQQIGSSPRQEIFSRSTILDVNTWVEQRVDLQDPAGESYEIIFEATKLSSFSDVGIDDVRFYSLPCADV